LKSFFSYSLLILFLTSLVRPVFPVVDYIVNFDYIAEVLCIKKEVPESSCNGKCYLMQQVEENKNESPESSIPKTQWEIQLLSLHQPMSYVLFFKESHRKLVFSSSPISFKTYHLPTDTPPPQQKSNSVQA